MKESLPKLTKISRIELIRVEKTKNIQNKINIRLRCPGTGANLQAAAEAVERCSPFGFSYCSGFG